MATSEWNGWGAQINEPARLTPTPPTPVSWFALFWVWWARITWWTHQTGRIFVSLCLACLIYVVFSTLPGLIALPTTALLLSWMGQYDVAFARAKLE